MKIWCAAIDFTVNDFLEEAVIGLFSSLDKAKEASQQSVVGGKIEWLQDKVDDSLEAFIPSDSSLKTALQQHPVLCITIRSTELDRVYPVHSITPYWRPSAIGIALAAGREFLSDEP